MTNKTIYLLASFLLLFAGGFLIADETIAWVFVLLGCCGCLLYSFEN